MKQFVKPLTLIGLAVIVVTVTSWFSIPAWRELQGGFLILLAAAGIGAVTFIGGLFEALKNWRDLNDGKKAGIEQAQTNGGAAVGGDVHSAGRFIGRDQIKLIINNHYGSHSQVERQELQQQLEEYLKWASETYGCITLRGIEQAGRQVVNLPLEQVYVPLQAERSADGRYAVKNEEISVEDQERQQQVLLSEIFKLGKRIIITGGPGSGKTTVLQHMAWALAESYCRREGYADKALGLSKLLPLYVPLSMYASHLRSLAPDAPPERATLAAFISEYLIRRQTNLDIKADFLALLLRSGKDVLLLLDGLDEVPDENERVRVSRAIDDLVAGRDGLHVVVTSRTAAYKERALLSRNFQHVRVLPLEEEQISSMISLAYRSIFAGSEVRAKSQADDLLKSIASLHNERKARLGEGAQRLVDSPLMVRLLLIVHVNERILPDQRADLYMKVVEAMLRPDYNLEHEVAIQIERQIGTLAMSLEIHQHLAFEMHQSGEKKGREIDKQTLQEALLSESTYAAYVGPLERQIRERGTLMEERGGLYRFIHLSFQEFLVGRYLALNIHDPDKIAAFLENGRLQDSWWREPILLIVGYLDISGPMQARRVLLRLAGADENANTRRPLPLDAALAAAELAAAAYLECRSQAQDLGDILQSRLRSLHQQAQKENCTPRQLADAMDGLDHLGWQPDDLHQFIQIPETEETNSFWIGKYPVTNIQYQRFIEADDFIDPQLWCGWPRYDENCQPMDTSWKDEPWEWLQKQLQEPDESPDGNRILPRFWHDPRFGIACRTTPVVGVSWYEASAYCRWLQRHWGDLAEGRDNAQIDPAVVGVRLPLESEWIIAAGGQLPKGRYPWDAPDRETKVQQEITQCANVKESGIGRTTPVWLFPQGASLQGVLDMPGNVWEWQANHHNKEHDFLARRGGSWGSSSENARVSSRVGHSPLRYWLDYGFRIVVLPR